MGSFPPFPHAQPLALRFRRTLRVLRLLLSWALALCLPPARLDGVVWVQRLPFRSGIAPLVLGASVASRLRASLTSSPMCALRLCFDAGSSLAPRRTLPLPCGWARVFRGGIIAQRSMYPIVFVFFLVIQRDTLVLSGGRVSCGRSVPPYRLRSVSTFRPRSRRLLPPLRWQAHDLHQGFSIAERFCPTRRASLHLRRIRV